MEKTTEKFSKIDFDEILKELLAAKEWFESIDRQIANTRFEEIIKTVSLINDYYKIRSLPNMTNETVCYSLTESVAFINIHKNFHSLSPSLLPKSKLKEILGGPYLPKEEILGSDDVKNRNTLFELELAARLIRDGVEVKGFNDFEFSYKGTDYIIECKRPTSEKNFDDNVVGEAVRQLKQRLADSSKVGIIAISMEKLIQIEEKFEMNKAIMERMKPISDEVVERHRPIWQTIKHPRIFGIFLIFKFIARLATENLYTACYLTSALPLKSEDSPEYDDFLKLEEILMQLK